MPLDIAHEHRNYLPGVILILAITAHTYKYLSDYALTLKIAAVGIGIVVLSISTYTRATQWGSTYIHTTNEAKNHPDSYRANYEAGTMHAFLSEKDIVRKETHYNRASTYFTTAARLKSNSTSPLTSQIILNYKNNKETMPSLISSLTSRLEKSTPEKNRAGVLIGLINCQRSQVCKLPYKTLEQLVKSAIQNPLSPTHQKAKLLATQAYLLANAGSYDKALNSLKLATENAPLNTGIRINLIEILIETKRFKEATKEINKALSLNKQPIYNKKLLSLMEIARNNQHESRK
ncbi:tetratricopeptide repeat protein [Pseudomonadota bacterium]